MFKKILKAVAVIGLGIALVVVPVSLGLAGQKNLEFAWNQNSDDLAQLDKWILYYGTTSGGDYAYNVAIPYDGVSIIHTDVQPVIAPDGAETVYYFVLTAVDKAGNESGPSNEVSHVFDFEAPSSPFSVIINVVSD